MAWLMDHTATLLWFFFGFKALNYLEFRVRNSLKRHRK